jgi:hypothetical protein
MNVFGRLTPEAVTDPHVRAQSQNWINQQVHAAVRANESTVLAPARQQEIEHENVPLISALRGVSYLQDVYRESLWVLMAVVVLVLLIACANLANFLLARAAMRHREIATRLALGSSRSRIARQSLIETLLLSVGGGLLGLAMAFAATRVLIAFVSQGSAWIAVSPAPNSGAWSAAWSYFPRGCPRGAQQRSTRWTPFDTNNGIPEGAKPLSPLLHPRTEHAKGAPACPGMPWGLASETWDPPSKGQSSTPEVQKIR